MFCPEWTDKQLTVRIAVRRNLKFSGNIPCTDTILILGDTILAREHYSHSRLIYATFYSEK